ncbi:hypothetical protein cyc_00421 [Cyclospora cayetanensis]|uniref:Uncharacterized protein n=1 Tax=Cyclospora cayetanensis TaxID=88456 RepID=A0A1D3D3G0_9EIME|nr:hypothetical protein cyc_00421 [Cyclospora cayetanensis]
MAAAVGPPLSDEAPWSMGLQGADSRGMGPPQAASPPGPLQPPAVSFGGTGAPVPPASTPVFHTIGLENFPASASKVLEQPAFAPTVPIGGVSLQGEGTDGASAQPWLVLPQQDMQQQLYYDSQPVLQQPQLQQRPQSLQQGALGDTLSMGMNEGPQWQPSLEYAGDGSSAFNYASACMLPSQRPSPYGAPPMPTLPFGEATMGAHPSLAAWQAGNPQQEALQGPHTTAATASFFGMCMGAPQGHPTGLSGNPEAPSGGGSWFPLQQQQPLEAPAMYLSTAPHCGGSVKPEGKGSKPCKNSGVSRCGDTGAESATGAGGSGAVACAATRPAKFFKQHSPDKAQIKPRGKGANAQAAAWGEGTPKEPPSSSPSVRVGNGQTAAGASTGGSQKPLGSLPEAGEGESSAPKTGHRPRAVRPSEVMAKMYFHRKKEAWRAELLIEGTKKQKSFSCRLYGYERARLMCEWARKFVLRTSRLPTDEETCTSLASLMKEPLPPQVPTGLPYMGGEYVATPGAPADSACPSTGDAQVQPSVSRGRSPPIAAEQQVGGGVSGGSNAAASVSDSAHGDERCALPRVKTPLDQRYTLIGICKKRKEASNAGEAITKVRKGSTTAQGSAFTKKGQASRGGLRDAAGDPCGMDPRRMHTAEVLPPSGNGGRSQGALTGGGDASQHLVSPYFSFANGGEGGAASSFGGSNTSYCGASDLPEVCQAEASSVHGAGDLLGAHAEDSSQGKAVGSRAKGGGDAESSSGPSASPWFEELEQLKKISRPKGGRAKRFNVGKKPFSGVRGIYFQQGLWKVKYRGDQEEAMKLFPYCPGDEKDMKLQFELARSFLRQVIDKGRHLHDSDGEGLSEDEPAWIVRSIAPNKWACKKEPSASSLKSDSHYRPKSPAAAASRRRAPASTKGPRPSATNEASRGLVPVMADEWQGSAGTASRAYFNQRAPLQQGGGKLSKGLPPALQGPPYSPPTCKGVPPPPWPQRGSPEAMPTEFAAEEACSSGPPPPLGCEGEAVSVWCPPQDSGEAGLGTAMGRPSELRLPLLPCRGVFTTADSPMCQRSSPREKSAFPPESSTGFFSAVTTTADEALPLGFCSSTGEGGGGPPKSAMATYPQSYFCCHPGNVHAEDMGSAAASCGSLQAEGTPLMPQPLSRDLQAAAPLDAFNGGVVAHSQGTHSGTGLGPMQYAPSGVSGGNSMHMGAFHSADGTPKGPECFLQFRPFVDQQTGHLETSLGEELLSVAGYPCIFGGTVGGCPPASQQMRGDSSPPFPSMEASSIHLVEQGRTEGAGRLHRLNPQVNPWTFDSPLAFRKPKDAKTREASEGTAPFDQGPLARAQNEGVTRARPEFLPWVVVRPREDEEKALTPLSGRAPACLLQGASEGCKFMQ